MNVLQCEEKPKHNIKNPFSDENKIDLESISDLIIKNYRPPSITNNDERLYNIILRNDVSQEEFDDFLKDWDIEEEGGMKALLLSYFMKTHPKLNYPEYVEPRLKGILQYYRFKNLKLISHFIKICNRLKEENIDIMIIKGGAIKHYRKDFPRIMGDIDILLRNKEDYDKCKTIVNELGYSYMEYGHSLDLHEGDSLEGILDIHHKISMLSDSDNLLNEDLFRRSHIDEVFNVENIYVPCIEDLMFITLINLTKNLIQKTSNGSKLHSAMDCMFFLEYKQDFDWNIVVQNAKKTNTEFQIYLSINYLNKFLPIKLPVEMFKPDNQYNSIEFMYTVFLEVLRDKRHKLNTKNAFKNMHDLLYYFKFRLQYALYKSKTIRKNPKLAKYVMEKQRLLV